MPISSKPTANLGETITQRSLWSASQQKDFKLLNFLSKKSGTMATFAKGLANSW